MSNQIPKAYTLIMRGQRKQLDIRTEIPRDILTVAEAVAMIESKTLSADLEKRLVGWMIETSKTEVAGRCYNYVSEEIALFVRAHRALIESLPNKD